ncbi:hypothetical protein B0H19DRAFT_710957 [Mycena capillaripes]|nr:hypothetical protein B0H19DRAFT_710957 [Mycena capillaripes]
MTGSEIHPAMSANSLGSLPPVEIGHKTVIRDLIRSHYQLPAGQLSSIISSLSEELSRCDEENARLQARMTELAVHRANIQEQYDSCHSLVAPVRSLPSELVAQIFTLSLEVASEPESDVWRPAELALYRLAQVPLLIVSQVCSRWHSIALGTPSLWSTIQLNQTLWHTPAIAAKAMGLLQSALTRGGNVPLTVLVTSTAASPVHSPALELLAQHSARWRAATLKCHADHLQHLSNIRGSLPALETLEIRLQGTNLETVTLFQEAPRLCDLAVAEDLLPHVSTPPLDQVPKIRCLHLASSDIAMAVAALSRLSRTNTFCMQFYLDDWSQFRSHTITLGLPPTTTSDVGRLCVEILGEFFRHHCQQALGALFAGLTLPCLEELRFESEFHSRFPLVWPQPQFLELARRSGFHTTLQTLDLSHVRITELQLLQCVNALPALEDLAVGDHERIRGRGVNLELVSDTLLRTLTTSTNTATTDTSSLIPRLHTFRARSRLGFTDSLYLDFILSRIEPEGRVFTSALEILLVAGRKIDDGVVARLRESVARGELVMSLP